MYCEKCGNKLSENTKFCGKCGSLISNKAEKITDQVATKTVNEGGTVWGVILGIIVGGISLSIIQFILKIAVISMFSNDANSPETMRGVLNSVNILGLVGGLYIGLKVYKKMKK